MSAFARFPARLQQAIVARLGWTALRPVQEEAGQAILDGFNAVILAPTAGGKTEASIFPILAQLIEQEPRGVGALYIAPIKALLNNQAERLGAYTEMVGLRRFLWHGDVTAGQRQSFIKEPAELLMTTPESLEVMLLSSRVPHPRLFAELRAVVIDEVHALAGTDRGAHLMSVIERLAVHSRHDVQRIGLSATVGNPTDILTWLQGSSRRSGRVVDPPKRPGPKDLSVRLCPSVKEVAGEACLLAAGQKSLFFCQSRSLTESVAERLRGQEIDVFVHHSSVSLEERQAAEERFHHGTNVMIACTSTLELGIDVGDLDRVFQAESPATVSSFLQRLGRTGRRAGQKANTLFLCQDPEVVLQASAIIELARQGWVESVPVSTRCWPVLVHQLLALSLQHGGITADNSWTQLSRVPDFAGISRAEFDELVAHLVAEDYLFLAGGLLTMGDRAEKVFGRKNFSELYAVFSSPQLYKVVTEGGRDIGSLEQDFVDKLVPQMSSFLLGGRPWLVKETFHKDRLVRVVPSPAGKKPTWGGYIPQFLGFDLCRKMASLLTSDAALPYLDSRAQGALASMRSERGSLLREGTLCVESTGEDEQVWTYAGGPVNQTIRYGLNILKSWTVAADNFRVRIRREERAGSLREALLELTDAGVWNDPEFQRRLLLALPEYRLSKFQHALPRRWSMEVVREYLLDVPRTVSFLSDLLGAAPTRSRDWVSEGKAELTALPEGPALAIRTLEAWDGAEPRFDRWIEPPRVECQTPLDVERHFLAPIVGRALDRLYEPGTLGLFLKLNEDDELPARDSIVLLCEPGLRDPDLGVSALRRLRWFERTDVDGQGNYVAVELLPRSTDRRRYPTLELRVPEEQWPTWRPFAVLLDTAELKR